MELGTLLIIIVLSIGAVQGVVFSIILFRSTSHNKVGNRILALILILLSYRLAVQVLRLFGLGYYDTWYYFMIDLSWIHGALIYFYTKSQVQTNLEFKRKDLIHFIPVALQIIISVYVRLQNLYWDGTRESLSWLGYHAYIVWMNNPTIYIIASMLIVYYAFRSRKLLNPDNESYEIPEIKLNWLRRIINSFFAYFLLVLIILLSDLIYFKSATDEWYFYFTRFYYYPFFIGIAILTYWICLEGFARRKDPGIILRKTLEKEELELLQNIAEKLENSMQNDELYKNPELSLNSLAKELEIKPYLISKSLSVIHSKRFNDFVNEYRVKEFQRLLKDFDNSRYTLLSLAMDSGFNSKSSFNRSIKKHLGISPSDLKPGGVNS